MFIKLIDNKWIRISLIKGFEIIQTAAGYSIRIIQDGWDDKNWIPKDYKTIPDAELKVNQLIQAIREFK